MVLYERTNKVKQAIAYARGKLLRDKCGMNNVRKGDAKKCALPKTLTLDVDDMKANLVESMTKDAATRDAVASLLENGVAFGRGAGASDHVFALAYEELLADAAGALDRLFAWLGKSGAWRRHAASGPKAAYAKATADDLRAVVLNFDEIRAWLSEAAPCLVAHLDAVDPGAVQADDCRSAFAGAIEHRLATSTSWRHARNSEVMELKVGNETGGNFGWKKARAVSQEQLAHFQTHARDHNAPRGGRASPSRTPTRARARKRARPRADP